MARVAFVRQVSTGQRYLRLGARSSVVACTLAGCLTAAFWCATVTPSAAAGLSVRDVAAPHTAYGALSGVACSSTRACTAVGNFTTRAGVTVPLAERWTGGRWRAQSLPGARGAEATFLVAVSCASGASCTAVGYERIGPGCSNNPGLCLDLPVAEGWNGARWVIEHARLPAGAKTASLSAVSCVSAKACVAVGSFSTAANTDRTFALVERWNGSSWSIQRTPAPPESELAGVSCTSRRACTAVGGARGSTLAERWNGLRWSVQRTSNGAIHIPNIPWLGSELRAVSCVSSTTCTAVGSVSYKCCDSSDLGLTERWNGSDWTVLRNPTWYASGEGDLAGVSCSSPTACTAIGDVLGGMGPMRWNGARWAIQRNPDPPGQYSSGTLVGIACPSATTCVAVGAYDLEAGNGPSILWAQRGAGSQWTNQRLASTPGAPTPAQVAGASSAMRPRHQTVLRRPGVSDRV